MIEIDVYLRLLREINGLHEDVRSLRASNRISVMEIADMSRRIKLYGIDITKQLVSQDGTEEFPIIIN